MSYNSQNTPFAIRRNNANAEAAEDEYDLSNLKGCMEAAYEEQKNIKRSSSNAGTRYVSAEGLAQLAEAGITAFETAERSRQECNGNFLPYNLIRSAMSGSVGVVGPYGRRLNREKANAEIVRYARFGGWLKTAIKLPALRRVITKTQSERGLNSPRTTIELWWLFEKFPSPGALERKLWAVRRRADAILTAYTGGQKASWASIAQALISTDKVGKAAVMAVAMTLSGQSFFVYRDARDWLVELHKRSETDTSDGVVARREKEPRLVKFGVAVYRIALQDQYHHWSFQCLVRASNGRTYHSDTDINHPYEALQNALHAWKDQDRLALMDADLIGFLNGDHGFCPLVIREDSYNAGNCGSGTEAWIREHGWDNREFIPGFWLIPRLDHKLVRNVAMNLYRSNHVEQERKAA